VLLQDKEINRALRAFGQETNFLSPSEIVEFTSKGEFVAQFSIHSAPGSAFGLALESSEDGFRFAAVDDSLNVLDVWVVR